MDNSLRLSGPYQEEVECWKHENVLILVFTSQSFLVIQANFCFYAELILPRQKPFLSFIVKVVNVY